MIDRIIQCDVTKGIPLPDKSVHCVVTSPPYWGLRDYGVEGQLGLEKTPEEFIERMVGVFRHVWRVLRDDGTCWLNMGDSYYGSWGNSGSREGGQRPQNVEKFERGGQGTQRPGSSYNHSILKPKDLCMMPARLAIALQADGWYLRSDIIWAKPNPMPESVTDRPTKSHEHIFLLTKSGNPLFWTNNRTGLGVRSQPRGTQGIEGEDWAWVEHSACKGEGCDGKRCVGGKVKVSFWQGRDYFYDADAVREVFESEDTSPRKSGTIPDLGRNDRGVGREFFGNPAGRNKRDVWTIPTQACDYDYCLTCHKLFTGKERSKIVRKDASRLCPQCNEDNWVEHFATFPEKLVQPCIKAGTSEKGCCPECGSPWVRVVEVGYEVLRASKIQDQPRQKTHPQPFGFTKCAVANKQTTTIGWKPTCEHGLDPIPCTVFDPFMGSGTVGLVAYKLNRHYSGTELKPDYIEMAEARIGQEKKQYALLEK